jgi:hypothetical protein
MENYLRRNRVGAALTFVGRERPASQYAALPARKAGILLSQRYLFIAIRTAATASPIMMATSHLVGSRWSDDVGGPLTSPPAVDSAEALRPPLRGQRKRKWRACSRHPVEDFVNANQCISGPVAGHVAYRPALSWGPRRDHASRRVQLCFLGANSPSCADGRRRRGAPSRHSAALSGQEPRQSASAFARQLASRPRPFGRSVGEIR